MTSGAAMTSIEAHVQQPYKYGFVTDIESEVVPAGLNEDVIRLISAKKGEPAWMLEWRLKAYRNWLKLSEPHWPNVKYGPIDYQAISYYAAPKQRPKLDSLDQVDPKLVQTFEKLGIPIEEQKRLTGVAVDAVFDSVSVATTFQAELAKYGVIFMPISQAIREHADLVQKYLGTVVPHNDNFFAALNTAVFTDGSFVYVPKGVRCPLELSTYFRINASSTGQFERTLIIAEEGSYVSYLEGCSAPMRDENQLHAAVVELMALDRATIKYSTIVSKGISAGRGQNTYRGLVKIMKGAEGARNYSQCDSMLIGDKCGAHTFPYIDVRNSTAIMEHEASTSKIGEDQIFYLRQRGLSSEDAVSMIVNGFCKEVFKELPMEFAVEATRLLGISLEGSVG